MINVIVTWFVTSDPQPQALAVDADVLCLDIPAYIAEWRDMVQKSMGERAQILVSTRKEHRVKPGTYNDFFGSLPEDEAAEVEACIRESEAAVFLAAAAALSTEERS